MAFQSINMVAGRLGHTPVLNRTNTTGVSICTISVAEARTIQEAGTWRNKTIWHQFTVWGKLAEHVCRILRKGSLALFYFDIDYQKVIIQKDGDAFEKDIPTLRLTSFTALANGQQGSTALSEVPR